MASPSLLLGRDDPVLDRLLAAALVHHHGRVELAAAHDTAPDELAVLRALGLGLEARGVARGHGLVHRVGVAVAVARGGSEAPVLEDQGVGVARGLAALEEDAV